MNFSINATHFQLGILPSSLQIEAIIEKIKCSNNFKPLYAPQYYQCTSLFFFKGASSSEVLTIQAHTVYELIKYYQTIQNPYESFGFLTLKANAVLNSDDAMTWYAPNKKTHQNYFQTKDDLWLYIYTSAEKKSLFSFEGWALSSQITSQGTLATVLPDTCVDRCMQSLISFHAVSRAGVKVLSCRTIYTIGTLMNNYFTLRKRKQRTTGRRQKHSVRECTRLTWLLPLPYRKLLPLSLHQELMCMIEWAGSYLISQTSTIS